MKRIEIIVLLVFGSVVISGAGFLFWGATDFRRYYGEAEPLVPFIWPMAHEVKAFVEEHGRRPVSFEELDRQSATGPDGLEEYSHRFFSEGPWIFHMTVNKRYGFGIDEEFRPRWTGAEPDTEPGTRSSS